MLDNEVALVTGAAMGMGASHARRLITDGARVVLGDVDADAVNRTAAELGERAVAVTLDVRSADSWADAVSAALEHFGALTVLVNNAGIVHREPFEQLSEADYRRVIEVNQIGPFLGMRAVIAPMKAAGHGSIVNVSSTAGLVGFPNIMGYVASKWAVRGMSKAAAIELAPYGIRVNTVFPGVIDTPMTSSMAGPGGSLLGRRGETEEVSAMVAFLASSASSYCTGGDFVVDGGETASTVGKR